MDFLRNEGAASAALDGDTFVIYPHSTLWEGPDKIKWWHPEGCTVRAGRCSCESVLSEARSTKEEDDE